MLPKNDHEVHEDKNVDLMPGLEAISTINPVDIEPASIATTKEHTPALDAGIASVIADHLADHLAPELRTATNANSSTVSQSAPHKPQADSSQASAAYSNSSVNFVPYSSPLKMFKAYRYHSNFRQDVPGGFKSLTYSNTIDPGLPLCPEEMAGAVCENPDCVGQHMRNMGLAGKSSLRFTTLLVG